MVVHLIAMLSLLFSTACIIIFPLPMQTSSRCREKQTKWAASQSSSLFCCFQVLWIHRVHILLSCWLSQPDQLSAPLWSCPCVPICIATRWSATQWTRWRHLLLVDRLLNVRKIAVLLSWDFSECYLPDMTYTHYQEDIQFNLVYKSGSSKPLICPAQYPLWNYRLCYNELSRCSKVVLHRRRHREGKGLAKTRVDIQ